MFDKGPRPEAFLLLKITYQSNPESTNWNFSFKEIVDRLLPPKWDNLVVSLPVLAFISKAMVLGSMPNSESVENIVGRHVSKSGSFRAQGGPESRTKTSSKSG